MNGLKKRLEFIETVAEVGWQRMWIGDKFRRDKYMDMPFVLLNSTYHCKAGWMYDSFS